MMRIQDYIEKINDKLRGPEKLISVEDVHVTSGVYIQEYLPTVPSGYISPFCERLVRNVEILLNVGGEQKAVDAIELADNVCEGQGAGSISRDETRTLKYLQSIGKKIPLRIKSPSTETLKALVRSERQNLAKQYG